MSISYPGLLDDCAKKPWVRGCARILKVQSIFVHPVAMTTMYFKKLYEMTYVREPLSVKL